MKAAIFCISNETIKKMVALRFKKSAFIITNEYLRNNIVCCPDYITYFIPVQILKSIFFTPHSCLKQNWRDGFLLHKSQQ